MRAGGREIGHLTPVPLTRERVRVGARNVAVARRSLPDVPFYQVEVSHRGKITVPNAELGQVALTLGS